MCITRILTQHGDTTISNCIDCGMLNIWHRNLLLCFTPEQFEIFQSFITELDLQDRRFAFPDGSERIILCTPNHDISLVFTETEWTVFNAAVTEALYLQQVYRLLE